MFEVAKSAIIERIKVPRIPLDFSAALAKGASDKYRSCQPTKDIADIATRI